MNTEVIAEIGKNFVITEQPEHEDILLDRAQTLVAEAKEAGANTVKFQVHSVEDEIHPDANIIAPHFDQDRYEWVKRNTYSERFWWHIKEYCRLIGIEFLATPMSRGAAELLDDVGVERWKIGSGDILDFVLLDYVRDSGKPIILSSGMSTLEELTKAYEYLKEKTEDITILHCVSRYPCPADKLNLATISFFKKTFPEAKIGFSDHSLRQDTGSMAATLGAEVIEKHFTLDRNAWGADHKVSLTPREFKTMVKYLTYDINPPPNILGIETKLVQTEETQLRKVFHKGLYANFDIKKGELLEPEHIISLRPKLPNARSAKDYPQFLGKFADLDYKKYEPL